MTIEQLDNQAPPGAFSTFDSEILVPAVEAIPDGGVYLEIGVDRGKSLWIARQVAKKSVEVYGMDMRPNPNVDGAIFIQGDAHESLKDWTKTINVLFIDGDHSYEGCKANIDDYYPFMADDGVILFHDCDESSPGVVRAVSEFVDTFDGVMRRWDLCKRTDKNTSISRIIL